jgi:SAM-dependent methyltransferase
MTTKRIRPQISRALNGRNPLTALRTPAASLIERQLDVHPHLRTWYEEMSDEQSRLHEGAPNRLEAEQFMNAIRYFHAWRIDQLRRRLGAKLEQVNILDVGDTDGLMLKHLGKDGIGFNLSPVAVDNIRSNGITAERGNGERMPFEDGSFGAVLCFETLEHVENPIQLLNELARICSPGGRVFISIPWVPRTIIHARQPEKPAGHEHIFEFCRDDFVAISSHASLEIVAEEVCELFGPAKTPGEFAVKALARRQHIVLGLFARFQFFELKHRVK